MNFCRLREQSAPLEHTTYDQCLAKYKTYITTNITNLILIYIGK